MSKEEINRQLGNNERYEVVLEEYYTSISPNVPKNTDICLYCGADNGPIGPSGRGVSRDGWDCCVCGGN